MSFNPISKPDGIAGLPERFQRWILRFRDFMTYTRTYTATIDPTTVGANATSEQTFAVIGIHADDVVTVNKPTHTSGLGIVNVRASAADQVAITYQNTTGSGIDAGSETYKFGATRH